ncbi:MAG: PAS domain-containing sensor histidine kinase [Robiginitomaculum sp.]|nr:MAG: PAS domain-containing sensor histidine kinase [Robiginitomaculum sp.]
MAKPYANAKMASSLPGTARHGGQFSDAAGGRAPQPAKRRTHSSRNKAGHMIDPEDSLHNTSAEARLAIGIVVFFVIAFILVVGMKLLQERRDALADAVLAQAFSATTMAEQMRTKLTDIKSYAEAAALALENTNARQRRALADTLLTKLSARPTVRAAFLFTPAGKVQLGKGEATQSDTLWSVLPPQALQGTQATFWVRDGPAGPLIYILDTVKMGGAVSLLAVEIKSDALIPQTSVNGTQSVLVDRSGQVVFASTQDLPAALLARIRTETGSVTATGSKRVISGFQLKDTENTRYVVGASSLFGGMLSVYRVKPLSLNTAAWKRTLTFFVLMTIAPLLVATVLCVILLVQMDTLKVARQALSDSEKRFRLAIEGASGGVWDWDLSTKQVFVTDSLARIFNWSNGKTVPVSEFLKLVHADDRQKLLAAMEAAPDVGEVDVAFRAAHLPIWLHARGRPWRAGNAMASGRIVGVAIDVTQQKGAQARLNAAEIRLRAALESMSESFAVWDVKRRLVMCNSKFREFFQLEASLLRPGTPYDLLERAADPAIKAVHEGTGENTIELELADGRWVHLSERSTRDGGLVSIGTDITALKVQEKLLLRKEKDLRESVKDLELSKKRISELAESYQQEKIRAIEANRSKSEFLANMSHELRTPLNAINGFSEIMQNEMYGPLGDPRYAEYVSDILGSGQHLLTLINDILDMSKIEAGKLSLQTEMVYPDELIEQCVRIVRGRAVESGLQLETNIGKLPEIEVDPRAIKQVLINLTSNAIKFTPEGGTVTIAASEERGGVRIEVMDTGIGIPEEHVPLICKPFVQVESQHSKSHKGSGLGLALSQSLVKLHGGEFELTSELGVGTKVSVWLPEVPKKNEGEAVSIWSMASETSADINKNDDVNESAA